MGGESATRTAPRSGGGTGTRPAGSRTGQRLSGLAVALGIVLFLGGFAWGALLYRPFTVPTSSMSPTIAAGDRVLGQRVDADEIRRGDVVVFTDKEWVTGALVVKRVVAVGGDTVACCTNGKLTVNGKEIDEPYLKGGVAEDKTIPTVKVPEGRPVPPRRRASGLPGLHRPPHRRGPGHGGAQRRGGPGGRRRLALEGHAGASDRLREARRDLRAGAAEHDPRPDRRRRRAGSGGGAYGPVAKWFGGRRGVRTEPAGAR